MNSILEEYFSQELKLLNCSQEAKSYIIGIFVDYKSNKNDLSTYSLTILYNNAKQNQDFKTFQNIGDWIFYLDNYHKQYLNNASREYYETLARLSYYSCYKLINKQWKLFEELADNYQNIISQTNKLLNVSHSRLKS